MTPAPKRRWFRFSLRTLFVAVTAVGMACGYGWIAHRVSERERLLNSLRMRGAIMGKPVSETHAKTVPFLWTILGARPVGLIVLPDNGFRGDELAEMAVLFPEATIQQHTLRMDEPTMGVGR